MSRDPHCGATKQLPFNSKRLIAANVKRNARALDVPSDSALDEVSANQGKVDHEPRNTQVIVKEIERGSKLTLVDQGGVYFTVEP